MGFELGNFNDPTLETDYVSYLVDAEAVDAHLHFSRFWDYFRNPIAPAVGVAADALNTNSRPYFQAQETGLPARITGVNRFGIGAEHVTNLSRKEVVIENDIAWRIHTMVDFLFGKPVSIRSLAREPETAELIDSVVKSLFESNGGQTFFQSLALMGSVYGFVDVVLRMPADFSAVANKPLSTHPTQPAGEGSRKHRESSLSATPSLKASQLASLLTLEVVEAPRIIPILDEDDFAAARYWIQCFRKQIPQLDRSNHGILNFGWTGRRDVQPRTVEVVEIISGHWWQRYENRVLLAEGPNTLGRIPVVHIQNVSLPGSYEGISDVEPLLGLQDELNTRLSDRAYRVTYQSFRMYLARGIDDFLDRPVGPGQMWSTHNPDASVQEFGHDTGSPSEDVHIEQVREAMDKVSGVTGLAAGLLRGNVGNLTSATALKVLLSGLISRTEKKRITYGWGLSEIISLVLGLLDQAGVLRTTPEDRRVEIHWPSPLPEDQAQRLADAQVKASLGVPTERVLAELGYDAETLGVPNKL